MSVNWTREQMQVIESRGTNLLVSAAAGSGKTAVLVERIIRMVTEGEHPLDIDRLLVMTFTNAAAAEMRERIGAAIEKKLEEMPENEHLQMQAALVHHARITTIDSFCLDLIRNHFNMLDLDPAFRIGDEGELTLLKGDVMEEMLEEYYTSGGERFVRFVETYASGKSDAGIEDYIMQVYTFFQSNPDPKRWIWQCRQELGTGASGERKARDEESPEEMGTEESLEGMESGEEESSEGMKPGAEKSSEKIEPGEEESLEGMEPGEEESSEGMKPGAEAETEEAAQKEAEGGNGFGSFPWMDFLMQDLKRQAGELKQQMILALEVCREDEFLAAYEPMFQLDIRQLGELEEAEDFEAMYQALSGISWTRLATVRSKNVDADRKAYVTGCRDRVKKAVGKMQEMVCFARPEEMLSDLVASAEPVEMLLELAEEFSRRYQEKKRERNLVDFNDLEHEALKVLIRTDDSGQVSYTEAADELCRQFEEVLVDEYQDSNLVQEALLHAVSQERFGRPNVFMVGDVKQSIYKFRLARPELFLEKYHSYEPYDLALGTSRKIELHQNFRSRASVLEGINDVFYRIMTENLGNIQYTEETALHPGAVFPEPEESGGKESAVWSRQRTGKIPELLVMDTGAEAFEGLEEDAADFTARELEAKLIAGKIREMTDPDQGMLVWDKTLHGTGGYRPARYGDMVILLRSTAGWTENLLSVLMNEGIPACAESRMGYFSTTEVETMLSILAVIDNPMQDIPLAAVLKSPAVGVTDLELAQLMAFYRGCVEKGQDRGIFAAMCRYLEVMDSENAEIPEQGEEGKNPEEKIPEQGEEGKNREEKILEQEKDGGKLAWKLRRFRLMLQRFRAFSTYLPIHELIYRVFEETGYYHLVSAMPAGETRKANLDMLVEKAADYEKTSYKGLFHFIRYIENLKKFNTDFGEASITGENEDTVRIMSIHKSKGLEFPVVFLAGMGKKFNKQDVYGKLLIDPELGIATDYLDLEHRLKVTTLKKNVLRRKMELDNLGEELRVLYVAMTRAKERLIMTGTDRHLAKSLEKFTAVPLAGGQVPYTILGSAGSYLDWILMSLSDGRARIQMTEILLADVVGEEMIRQVRDLRSKEQLLTLGPEGEPENPYQEKLLSRLNYRYPYEADIRLHTKMAVSELKKQGQGTDEEESHVLFPWEIMSWDKETEKEEGRLEEKGDGAEDKGQGKQEIPDIRFFLEAAVSRDDYGATRGTAYHRALELLPFSHMEKEEDVRQYLASLVEKERFGKDSLDLIDCKVIWRFLQSGLGRRMILAEKEGRLHKEQQFVVGISARDMGAGDSDELVVVQGIIDAYMEEDGQLIVVDYKTDQVPSPRILTERYKGQLDYYGRALEQMTGKAVKEKIIYSLSMGREMILEDMGGQTQ